MSSIRCSQIPVFQMLALAALVSVLYWPVVGFDFVNWDDPWYVIENPLINSWHPANLWDIATQVYLKNYAPLTMLSYLVDHSLWGLWPGGYHLTNGMLHLLNVLLVYALLVRLTRSRVAGWLTAALFAVHPVHIETVAWVSSRKGLLSAAFILASLICWLQPKRTGRDEAFGLLFFVLALLSKAIAIVVPAVVLLSDVLVNREPWSKALPRQLIPGFLAACLLSITMSAQVTEMGGVREHMEFGKARILAVDSIIVWQYIEILLRPVQLCVLYDPPTRDIATLAAVAVLGWIGVGWIAWQMRRETPLVALAVAVFFLFLLPVLNLFPITTLMNDRYLYLPSIPFFGLLAAGCLRLMGGRAELSAHQETNEAEHGTRRGERAAGNAERKKSFEFRAPIRHSPFVLRVFRFAHVRPVAVAALVGCALLWYASRTREHLPVWQNGFTLWHHAVRHAPQLPVVQIQLANTLHAEGRNREAVAILMAALDNPRLDHLDRRRIRDKLSAWQ